MANQRSIQTSLFSLTNNSTNPNQHSVAIKNSEISTSYSHYAFGTAMFFPGTVNDVVSSGGLGFFTSSNGNTGYYVSVQTTTHLSDTADKEIKIYKVVNGKKTILADSQKTPAKTLTGVLAGTVYKLDVNVIVESTSVTIDAYVNSYKITATDSSSPLSKTSNVVFATVGINKLANILGQRLTSFGAEVFVLNNSGMMIPLADGNLYSFAVVGNSITISGEHEYNSNTLSDTTTPEPVVFETAWIQREDDAKNLATWIQTQWSKQQRVIEMEIFSNPLISVGDIITVNYPKNDLDGTQKFVVTRVSSSFREGLNTRISARSIYS